jgi:hypothetical protein
LRWTRSIPTRAHGQSLGRIDDRAAMPNRGYARSESILVLVPRFAAAQSWTKKQRQLFLSTPQTQKGRRRSDKAPKGLKATHRSELGLGRVKRPGGAQWPGHSPGRWRLEAGSRKAVKNLVPLAKALKQRHVPLGVIYDADSFNNSSDEDWSRNMISHFAEVESELGVHPDHAVIETWVRAQINPFSLWRNAMRKFLLVLTVLLAGSTAMAAAPPSTSTSMPQIWFSLGGQGKPATYQSWDTLFYEPDAPWPEFMDHVRTIGVLTQVLAQISDAGLAKVVARLKEKRIGLGVEMLAQAYALPGVDAPAGCGGGC